MVVRVRDNGYDALKKTLEGMTGAAKNRPRVDVGVTQKTGSRGHGGATIAEIATWHEFGINQHERSWLREWYDERESWIKAQISGAQKRVLQGKITQKQALEQLGMLFAGDIKKRITAGNLYPNADSTIARKGSSTPLIDEGIFLSSITHEVHNA